MPKRTSLLILGFFLLGCSLTSQANRVVDKHGSGDVLDDISGTYRCEGKNYSGTTIIKKSGDAYQLLWSIGTTTHQGVALRNGDLLSSSWLPIDARAVPGIVVYRIEKDGVLRGKFTSYPGGRVEEETLTFQAPLN